MMKISDASISFFVDQYLERKQASISSQTYHSRVNKPFLDQAGQEGFSDRIRDKVSISRTREASYQSNYSSQSMGKSVVRTSDLEKPSEFTWQTKVETIVGGIINKTVALQNFKETPADNNRVMTEARALETVSEARAAGRISEMTLQQTDVRFEQEQLVFSSQGGVLTEDGRSIDFSFDMEIDRAFFSKTEEQTIIKAWQERVPLHDPLVISFDGNAPELTDTAFEFDLFNDGFNRYISFVAPGSGFLAFDRNNDQVINNGSELFGPMTGNGFSELAAYDGDHNSWIDENDAVFEQLSVWTRNDAGEDRLISLKEAGIGAIYLDHEATRFTLAGDDNALKGRLRSTGMYLYESGSVGTVHQVDLAMRTAPDRIRDSVPPHSRLQKVDSARIDPGAGILTDHMSIR